MTQHARLCWCPQWTTAGTQHRAKGVGKGEASKNMGTLIQSNKRTLGSEKRKHRNTESSNPGNMEKVSKEGGPGMDGRSQQS